MIDVGPTWSTPASGVASSAMGSTKSLDLALHRDGQLVLLDARGTVDHHTGDAFVACLDTAFQLDRPVVVVDLTRVAADAAAVVPTLVRARREALAAGLRLLVVVDQSLAIASPLSRALADAGLGVHTARDSALEQVAADTSQHARGLAERRDRRPSSMSARTVDLEITD